MPIDAPHLGSLKRAAQKHTNFEKVPLRTHEEVAGFPGEHDRFMRGIDPLLAKRSGGLAQPFPSIPQILGEILREGRLGRRPAVMFLPFLDPLLAVVAFSTGHN